LLGEVRPPCPEAAVGFNSKFAGPAVRPGGRGEEFPENARQAPLR